MKPFCEVIVASVLPAIRSIMTRELLNTYGLKQQEVADLLGITQPAVSQYIRESRGMKVKLLEKHPEIMKMIDDFSRDIVHEKIKPKEFQLKICGICKSIRKNRLICHLHEEMYPSIAPCSICTEC